MKSPIKDKPLRNPGESLEQRAQDLLIDKGMFYGVMIAFMVTFSFLEWWRWYKEIEPNPIVVTVIGGLFSLYCLFRFVGVRKQVKKLYLGLDGEKAVGQYLERLRTSGAQVFHDIQADGFNLDHVVIHPTGIYVIETKTMSKPSKGSTVLFYNGRTILRQGKPIKGDPVTQVKAAAKWLSQLLQESTGKRFPVRGIVTYPGWFIKTTDIGKSAEVAVINPRMISGFLWETPDRIAQEDLHMCAYHLSRYIRTHK